MGNFGPAAVLSPLGFAFGGGVREGHLDQLLAQGYGQGPARQRSQPRQFGISSALRLYHYLAGEPPRQPQSCCGLSR